MRQQAGMKLLLITGLTAGVWAGTAMAQNSLASLGVGDATGKEIVDRWLGSGYLNATPAAKAFKAAAPASRAGLVKNAIAWAKSYTESPAFKAAYEKERQASRPSPPEVSGTVEEELARQRAERRKSIEDRRRTWPR